MFLLNTIKNALRTGVFSTHSRLLSTLDNEANAVKRYPWSLNFRISKTRCYFPRPNETQRIRKHGWDRRMSTPGGRKVLMNRILKGRHVLSH